SRGFNLRQDFIHMSWHFDFAPDARDAALLVNEKCSALYAHISASVELLLDPHPIALACRAVFIGGQNQLEPMFRLEFIVLSRAVARDAYDNGARRRESAGLFSEA